MTTEVKIRIADPEDGEAVFPLAKAMATSFEVEEMSFEAIFAEILADSAAICLVAEKGERIIGYLIGFDHRTFYANGRVSWVEEIFVLEDFRIQGIGRELMEGFEDWCVERGSRLVGLATRRASDFYRAIHYEESAVFFKKQLHHNRVPETD